MFMKYLLLIAITIGISLVLFKLIRFPKNRIGSALLSILFLLLLTFDSYEIIAGGEALWRYHYPLAGINVAFFGAFVAYGVNTIFKKEKVSKCVFFIAGALFLMYGMVNMYVVNRHDVSLQSNKVSREHRFVFLSDTHEEGAQPLSQLEKAVEEINRLDIEFVVLGGDITDEYTTKENMEKTYAILGQLKAPTYFIHGNHDLQFWADRYAKGKQYTEQELEDTIKANGITILKDEFVEISDDLVICGRLDRSYKSQRKDYYSLENPAPEACTIVFDHQGLPQFTYEVDHNADFQISGHTHAGQFWPLDTVYHLVDYNSEGIYQRGQTTLYVSSGFAGWKIPYRTSSHCRYEVFMLTK